MRMPLAAIFSFVPARSLGGWLARSLARSAAEAQMMMTTAAAAAAPD